MTIEYCNARHVCADGSEGRCSSIRGHYGRHVCAKCLTPFIGDAQPPAPGMRRSAQGPIAGNPPDKLAHTTEYLCAHCSNYNALSDKRCSYCRNLLCWHCEESDCPTQFKKCAHCSTYIPARKANTVCNWCGYEVCANCSGYLFLCPKAPRCYHCDGPFKPQDEQVACGCNQAVHRECLSKCPRRLP